LLRSLTNEERYARCVPHRSSANLRQTGQADLVHVGHLEHDQGVVVEKQLATNDGQVWEQGRQRAQSGDAVEEQVVGDLSQSWERQVGEVQSATVVSRQNDVQVPLDHRTVDELAERRRRVTNVHRFTRCSTANYNLNGYQSHTHTHTHTHQFNGPLSRTTQVSLYQKGKTNLDFTEARDSEWQWHQLGHYASLHLAPDR